jgi:hypothetical protein
VCVSLSLSLSLSLGFGGEVFSSLHLLFSFLVAFISSAQKVREFSVDLLLFFGVTKESASSESECCAPLSI